MTMLLRNFEDAPVRYPTWCERKYDGIRCIIIVRDGVGVGMSRDGHVIAAADGLAQIMAAACGDGCYDGELDGGSWSATQSAVKRNDPRGLVYRAWDALTLDEWTRGISRRSLSERKAGLVGLLNPHRASARVTIVKGVYAQNEHQLGAAFLAAVDSGWEGLVIKDPTAPYLVGQRSGSWSKRAASSTRRRCGRRSQSVRPCSSAASSSGHSEKSGSTATMRRAPSPPGSSPVAHRHRRSACCAPDCCVCSGRADCRTRAACSRWVTRSTVCTSGT